MRTIKRISTLGVEKENPQGRHQVEGTKIRNPQGIVPDPLKGIQSKKWQCIKQV